METEEPPFFRDEKGKPYSNYECPACYKSDRPGKQMEARMYPIGHTEVWVDCELCGGECVVDLPIIEPRSDWNEFFYGSKYEYW